MDKRNRRKRARMWLFEREIRQVDIQRALNFKHKAQVHGTLWGNRNDRKVLRYLLDIGCPPGFLDLPADMRVKNVAYKRSAVAANDEDMRDVA